MAETCLLRPVENQNVKKKKLDSLILCPIESLSRSRGIVSIMMAERTISRTKSFANITDVNGEEPKMVAQDGVASRTVAVQIQKMLE